MAAIHQFQCDRCVEKAPANWNGEHWLPPIDWVNLQSPSSLFLLGHLCPMCNPLEKLKAKKPEPTAIEKQILEDALEYAIESLEWIAEPGAMANPERAATIADIQEAARSLLQHLRSMPSLRNPRG